MKNIIKITLLVLTTVLSIQSYALDDDKTVKHLESALYELLGDSDEMNRYRSTPAACGQIMRSKQPLAYSYRGIAQSLPFSTAPFLKTASGHMIWCVSCSSDAVKYCNLAKEAMKDHEHDKQYINER